jgi:cytochrome c556
MHAAALDNQGKMFASMWPEGSMGPTSRAKAEIWTQKADFDARVKAFADAAAALHQAAMKGDNAATMTAFTAFNATCGGCHMPFRGPAIAPAAPAGGAAPAPN